MPRIVGDHRILAVTVGMPQLLRLKDHPHAYLGLWLGTGPRGRGSADLFLAAGYRTRRPAAVPDMAIALSGPRGPRPGSAFPGLQCPALAGGRSRGARE
jgi:hypothetical protein